MPIIGEIIRRIQVKHPIISESAIKAVREILKSGALSSFRGNPDGQDGGLWVQALETAFRKYFGVYYAIALNSATAGLELALRACGIREGDEVIVSPYTFSSSASCALMVGAIPVFVDIDPDTFCIDPDLIEEKLTPKTKAIIPVDLCGQPAEMGEIRAVAKKYNLFVIEDAAQAIGASYGGELAGTMGDCGIFSFNQSKHVSAGEGGMLITNNEHIARVVRALRNHGEVSDPELKMVGYNFRLCEIEACLALDQFTELDSMNAHRVELTDYMTRRLKEIPGLTPPVTRQGCFHVFYTYFIKYNEEMFGMSRDDFQDKMIERGIYMGKGYVKPLYLLPIYQQFGYKKGLCPVAERMWKKEAMVTDWLRYPASIQDVDKAIEVMKDVLRR